MKDFSHLNVLTLMGVALDARGSPCLVMPYMSNGSLCEYLRKEHNRAELLWERGAELELVVSSKLIILTIIYCTIFNLLLLCFLYLSLAAMKKLSSQCTIP